MKNLRIAIVVLSLGMIFGCLGRVQRPQTGHVSGYSYIPIDPIAIKTNPENPCKKKDNSTSIEPVELDNLENSELFVSLPDNSVRVSIQNYLTSGRVTYGIGSVQGEIDSYRLTVDFINSDTINVKFWIKKTALIYEQNKLPREMERVVVPLLAINDGRYYYNSESFSVLRQAEGFKIPEDFEEFNLPIYVGVGIRVSAAIESSSSKGKIEGLGMLTAQGLRGTLVTQTLGVNGKDITAALPIQSELNPTTAQNAIAAVGAIKALLHKEGTVIIPRAVGLYLPFPGEQSLVNAIVSQLSAKPVGWNRPCIPQTYRPATQL